MPDICIQHMVAIMLLDGTVSFASSHDEARMDDPTVKAMRDRIELIAQSDRERRTAEVEIRLADGQSLKETEDAVRGTPDNPMERAEVDRKAHDLMAPILGADRSRSLIDQVWSIEALENARALQQLLMA
jgi:2-methylcitrate dehydratase PrpD